MKSIFGKSKKKVQVAKNEVQEKVIMDPNMRAISKMKKTVENITKRQTLIETKMKKELMKAADYKRKNKKKEAIICLKRKKLYEKEYERVTNSIFSLEQQVLTLESAHTASEMVKAQQDVKNVMQKLTEATNVDNVIELQDEIQEQLADFNEVNDILAEPAGELEDADLNDELEALLQEDLELEEEAQKVNATTVETKVEATTKVNLPEAPNTEVKISKEEEDDLAELQKLATEMAM